MSKHKQFGPEKKGGETGLDIECQGSWIEKETRQEKKAEKRRKKTWGKNKRIIYIYFFFHRTQERGMKYKTNKSKK